MVFHITNYMRETNVWMIRKMRWVLWGLVLSTPIYRNTYWDYLGRRIVWKDAAGLYGSEQDKKEHAESNSGLWGYTPRYKPVYDFSIKTRKQEGETEEERINDTPRLTPTGNMREKRLTVPSEDVRQLVQITMEHNRKPGVFDYNFNQPFYSHYQEIDQETYLVIGDRKSKGAHTQYQDGLIRSAESKAF